MTGNQLFSAKRRFLLIMTAVIIMMWTFGTAAWADTSGPAVSSISPTNNAVLNSNNVQISFSVADPDKIDPATLQLTINGTNVPITAKYPEIGHYETYYDSCGSPFDVWVLDSYDYTRASVTATANNLPDFNHAVITVKDQGGYGSNIGWNFQSNAAPVIDNLTPGVYATTTGLPVISAKLIDNGIIDANTIVFKIDGNNVAFNYDAATGVVSYTSLIPLAPGWYPAYVQVMDTAGNLGTVSWMFGVRGGSEAGPVLAHITPIQGSTFTVNNQSISFVASDNDGIASGSVQVNINGTTVTPTVKFKEIGHYETAYDSCSGPYAVWVVDGYDYTSATITAYGYSLLDRNNVSVSAADQLGNMSTISWSFTTSVAPSISSMTPANGSNALNNLPLISAVVSDNESIDVSSVIMKLSGTQVNAVYTVTSAKSGRISYNPPEPLSPGIYQVEVQVKDTFGNSSSKGWTFTVMEGSNSFANPVPAPGTKVSVASPVISVQVADYINLNANSALMLINGTRVTPKVAFVEIGHYETYYDSCTGDPYQQWVLDGYDYTKATLSHTGSILPDGTTNVSASIANTSGGTNSCSWNFNVGVPPQIGQLVPAAGGTVTSLKPLISAGLSDNGMVASAYMLVDGIQVPATLNAAKDTLSYTPVNTLANDSQHTVHVTVYDGTGAYSSKDWQFLLMTFPYMPISGKCTDCHVGYPYPNHPMGNCGGCHEGSDEHGAGYPVNDCRVCHGSGGHSAGVIQGWQCSYCHNSTYSYKIPIHPADNDVYHNTTTGFSSCGQCHVKSLTREHYRYSFTGTDKKFDCTTCHSSTAPQRVKDAVANKDKRCQACHDNTDHMTVHNTQALDNNCTTCHINNLYTEHLDNPKTQTASLDCRTCHAATPASNLAVYNAIYNGNIQCAACHSLPHNFGIAEKVYSDIPLYDGFNWSIPADVSVWAGELWIGGNNPAGSRLVLSNRRLDISGDNVFQFYNAALTGKGWTLETPAPAAGTDFFTSVFRKGSLKATVMFDNREVHDLSSPVVQSGYRITIVFN